MKKVLLIFLLMPMSAFAYYTQTIPDSCGAFMRNELYAVFTPNQYTCSAGQFLPANTLGCASCPADYTCVGGTFDFNAEENQGLPYSPNDLYTHNLTNACAKNAPHALFAEFIPNTHTCSAGYYLPMGVDACTSCPANSYCVGGTYSFNENINQGIANCDNGYHSSAGSSSASSCEPNIIQITWQGAELADVLANHAETCTYGGDVRTPVKAIHIPGMTFVGWTVAPQQQ